MTIDVDDLLQGIARHYTAAHTDLHGINTPTTNGRRTPPGPRAPNATAVPIRAALIGCARHLTDAHTTAGGATRPGWPGYHRLGWRTHLAPRTWWNRNDGIIHIDPDHPVYRWAPEPTDLILHVPTPHDTHTATLHLARQAAATTDQTQHDATIAILHAADTALLHAGGHNTPTIRICIIDYCRTPIHSTDLCRSHYDQLQTEKRRRRRHHRTPKRGEGNQVVDS